MDGCVIDLIKNVLALFILAKVFGIFVSDNLFFIYLFVFSIYFCFLLLRGTGLKKEQWWLTVE